MDPIEIILLIVIAALCGALGQAISGYSLGGLVVSIVVGFIGAVLGRWFYLAANPPELWILQVGNVQFPVIWSIIGATVFALFVAMFQRRRPYYY
jgi:uncharacterized membrane protein YeaQ/YmgE (transglycosylase-associated protein family)